MFYTIPSKDGLTLKPHPDEVDAIQWVTKPKLIELLNDTSLLFSPWFRLIVQKWLLPKVGGWWDNLEETMTTDKHCDFTTIHEFDPPKEHYGGGGNAGPLFLKGDEA